MDVWEAINNAEYRDCMPIWSGRDLSVVNDAERALADALQLKRWWEQKESRGAYAQSFELARTYNRADRVTGFFDTASLNGKDFPVMGLVQEMVFDKAKQPHPEMVRDELREFILHYFMRVSSTQGPEPFIARNQRTKGDLQSALQPFSFCPQEIDSRAGFGYTQLFYKLRGSGYRGKFPAHLQPRIVDLRRMDDIYEWIVLEVALFGFSLNYTPFANGLFSLLFPLKERTYIATNRDFIVAQDNPTSDLLGRYGLGYALLKPAPHKTIFAYGPGHFSAGFQTIDFEIDHQGQTRVRMVFVANPPTRVMDLNLNPVSWGFGIADVMTLGLASGILRPVRSMLEQFSPHIENVDPVSAYIDFINLMTLGLAKEGLCSSLKTLEKDPMLLTHFMEHYYLISGALMTWRKVQSWLAPSDIPLAVREGTSS